MLQKYEKYFYIVSPILVLISLVFFYLKNEFGMVSIVTLSTRMRGLRKPGSDSDYLLCGIRIHPGSAGSC